MRDNFPDTDPAQFRQDKAENVSIEQMKSELKAAGWTEKNALTWISPAGYLFRGPFMAWCELIAKESWR